ncbi:MULTISPECIES: chemoreceptor glutamine deamidase CheD [unclassified Neptuniibacter]|uniref:chemoreceptor glutamine deamidase CheD n=1 Tax=unclassified Neptuniibacter TaxID=2630693 RepID=UPI0025FF6334|nr:MULTISPECIES: chemoreceptor glutamine deamidase CheD [unclassified Neptuniibacter]
MNRENFPEILNGFESIMPFWEPRWEKYAVKVKPGEYYVSRDNIVITTVLGSCVSACIFDPQTGLGGINHFMLPSGEQGGDLYRSSRYGLFAMEQLINELMKHGSQRSDLQVKLAGGGDMISGLTSIGQQNIDFILQYIKDEGLKVVASDLGGDQARRIAYFPQEGRMLVNKLDHREDQKLIEEEKSYRVDVDEHLDDTDVELF